MGNYVNNSLNRNETVARRAILSPVKLITLWVLFVAVILITVIVPKMIVSALRDSVDNAKENSLVMEIVEEFADDIDFDLDSTLDDVLDQIEARILAFLRKPFYLLDVLFGILAIWHTIRFFSTELAFTNKRVIGKSGVFSSSALDAPLEKIDSAVTSSGLLGKIFGYGKITVRTASDSFTFKDIKRPEEFKRALMAQIDQAEEDRIAEQAKAMATAVASANNPNA